MGFLVSILIHNYFSIHLHHHPCQKRSWWKCNLMSDCIIKQHNWPLFVRPSDKLHQFNGILLVFNLNVSSLKGRWQRIILLLLYDLQAIHALYVLLRKLNDSSQCLAIIFFSKLNFYTINLVIFANVVSGNKSSMSK